jgi:hypothetical protein
MKQTKPGCSCLKQFHDKASKRKLTLLVLEPIDEIDLGKRLRRGAKHAVHQDVGVLEGKSKLFACGEDDDVLGDIAIESLLVTSKEVEVD